MMPRYSEERREAAVAKHENCVLLDVFPEQNGEQSVLVGVFHKQRTSGSDRDPAARTDGKAPPSFDPLRSPSGTVEEEATTGDANYLEVLARLHERLNPSLYLEIGIRHGKSLGLAQGKAIGIDPAPDLQGEPLGESVELIKASSDEYFFHLNHSEAPPSPDLAFIDGMHLFEFALRDFMNIERLANPGTVVVIDDIFPSHPIQAERRRRTRVWTGDVWKLFHCLKHERLDLILFPLNTHPTGLLVVAGLNPDDRTLWSRYSSIVRHYGATTRIPDSILHRENAVPTAGLMFQQILSVLPLGPDQSREARNEWVEKLRLAAHSRDLMDA